MRKTIGRYRLESKLGEGGMGVVYAAVDDELGRRVALKMIHEAAGDPTAHERMWREARAAAGISHPNICQVLEVGEDGDELFLAMELLEGEPLADRVERGALPLDDALDIALEILSALEALHQGGFLHRDLKPSNVFLTAHGVKLLDFGLALPLGLVEGEEEMRLTATGMMVGTPAFMAPEQWRGEPLTPASDVFAVGALLFEMLAGKPAFGGSNPMDLYHAIAHDSPPALVGGASIAAIDRVLQRALAKQPHDRYMSAAEMAADLGAARRRLDSTEAAQISTVTRLVILPFRALRPDADMEFLCFGLPDAIATSLSSLESLAVRSCHARADGEVPDIAEAAREAKVDRVLAGTILRAGERLRVTVQLVQASDGAMLWSESVDATVEDIFELQDELARRIVASLRVKLTERDARDLEDARPATPEAYEYYLRANQLSYNSAMLASARDLYEACLERDPDYAPAWARLGRALRVMAKYAHGDVAADYQRAEDAFRRALELDPELTVAHNLFTHFQIEQLIDAPGAMVRLLEQAARHPADPELFSGLVVACRFCGLLDASIAADRRARRLDPGVRTSAAYSYWMHADYTAAMRHDDEDMRYVTLYALPLLGREDEALALSRQLEADRSSPIERAFATSARAALEGDLPACRTAVAHVVDSRFGDAEGLFHLARDLARAGDPEHALAMLSDIVAGGLHCPETYERDPWLASVRDLPGFEAVLARARAGRAEAEERFLAAGGGQLLLLER